MKKTYKILFLFVLCIFILTNIYASDNDKYKIDSIKTVDGGREYRIVMYNNTVSFMKEEYNNYIKDNIIKENGEQYLTEKDLKTAIIQKHKKSFSFVKDSVDSYLATATYKWGKNEYKIEPLEELPLSASYPPTHYGPREPTGYTYEAINEIAYRFGKLLSVEKTFKESIDKLEKIDYKLDVSESASITNKEPGMTYTKTNYRMISEEKLTEFNSKIKAFGNMYKGVVDTYNADIDSFNTLKQSYINYINEKDKDTQNNPQSVEAKCGDNWWGCAFQFMELGESSSSGTQIPGMLSELQNLVFDIGNIIFMVVTAFLGVKYIWGGVDSKFSVKNSLVTLVVAAVVFYGWNAVTDILNVKELLTGSSSASGYENFATTIYNTIMYVVNVAAIGGIIYIGIKYMMAGADGKAEMKLKFIPVIMGIIMVYGTLNLINFILDIVYTF